MSISNKDRRYVLGAVYLLVLYNYLSLHISNPALPSIMGRMNSLGLYTFCLVLQGMIQCVATPVGGKIGDTYGRKTISIISILSRTVTSVICAIAPNVPIFMLGLVLHAVSGGLLSSIPAAILSDISDNSNRSKYFGFLAATNALGLLLGMPIGGLLLDNLGPEWCFLAAVPVALAGALCLIKGYKIKPQNHSENKKLDVVGLLLLTAALVPALVWLNFGDDKFNRFSLLGISLLVASVVFTIIMIIYELRVENPSIPVRMFKYNELKVSFSTAILVGFMVVLCSNVIIMYGQVSLFLPSTISSLLPFPKNLVFTILPIFLGRWVAKNPNARYRTVFLLCGLGMLIGGLLSFTAAELNNSLILIIISMLVFGVGTSCQGMGTHAYVQENMPREHIGAGAAMVYLGGSISNSVASAVFGAFLNTRYNIDLLIPEKLQSVLGSQALSALSDPNTIANAAKLEALKNTLPAEILPDLEEVIAGMRAAYAETFKLYSLVPIAAGLLVIIITILLIKKLTKK